MSPKQKVKMRAIFLLSSLLVSGCAGSHELAQCKGPLEALNPSHWQPTKPELDALAQRVAS
jgi:hypothetical protein